ncbi:hypothetical protein L6164_000188 [Bauhinia variegata]|uniref:Uncharacterized protein n=1 Tax=Bauhinia variegata TaxID=167791 RepID=A0ACB9Q5P2_BAUVA|nr:hypothetical protein L6164_000188 [Bauhinia variegata]
MAGPVMMKLTCLAVMVCLVLGLPMAESVITCTQTQSAVVPCLGYLKSGGATVPAPCCNAVRSLNNLAKTTPDWQAACRCIEAAVKAVPGIKPAALSAIPGKCGIHLPFQISPTMDCSKQALYISN